MKKHMAFLAAALLFPVFGHAAEGYKLVCDQPVFNFGTVDQSAVITNVFTIRNDGDMTYPHKYIRTSCGCTRAKIGTRMIGPGETAEVTVVYKAAGRKGKQRKKLWVIPMNDNKPALELMLKGLVSTNAVTSAVAPAE